MVQRLTAILAAVLLFPALAMAQAAVLQGTVEKIDKDRIVLKTDAGQQNVELSAGTKGIGQAKVGDQVTISVTKSGDKLVASSISASKDSSPKAAPSSRPSDGPSNRPLMPGGAEGKRPGDAK
jgi:hypothetical protein